jgi:pyruvate dehydrogenase (quinone)
MAEAVADFLLARLRAWNVKQVFGYPGDAISGLLAAWGRAEHKPQFVQARRRPLSYHRVSNHNRRATANRTC